MLFHMPVVDRKECINLARHKPAQCTHIQQNNPLYQEMLLHPLSVRQPVFLGVAKYTSVRHKPAQCTHIQQNNPLYQEMLLHPLSVRQPVFLGVAKYTSVRHKPAPCTHIQQTNSLYQASTFCTSTRVSFFSSTAQLRHLKGVIPFCCTS